MLLPALACELEGDEMTDDEYKAKRTRLSQIVQSNRTRSEIESLMAQTAKRRREWISDVNPTITEIIQAFPHFTDTPGMVGKTKRIE